MDTKPNLFSMTLAFLLAELIAVIAVATIIQIIRWVRKNKRQRRIHNDIDETLFELKMQAEVNDNKWEQQKSINTQIIQALPELHKSFDKEDLEKLKEDGIVGDYLKLKKSKKP